MFEFLKKCYNPVDGDYYYTIIASAYSYDFAKRNDNYDNRRTDESVY